MRALVLALVAASLLAGTTTASAARIGPPIPDLSDCHAVNDLLGIDNVRDCDNNG